MENNQKTKEDKQRKFKSCEIVSDCEHLKEEKIKNVIKKLEHGKNDFEIAYILHDKDKNENGDLKKAHYHIYLRLQNGRSAKDIGKWFGITENFISKIKGGFGDALKYATHENAPEKYQYDVSEVVTNFDIEKVKKTESKKNKSERGDEIRSLITSGVIREYNIAGCITDKEYDIYGKLIKNAFEYRTKMLIMKEGNRDMECIYITGDSGSGKTAYAKYLMENKNMSYYVSSSSNDILDNYEGQDAIILDDLRRESMSFADLLKMLDNNTSSLVKSRYKNKFLECKYIIVTSVLSIEEFFNQYFTDGKEPIEQLKRRCKTYITIKKDKMYIKRYDDYINNYSEAFEYNNPIYGMYKKAPKTSKELKSEIDDLIGTTKQMNCF